MVRSQYSGGAAMEAADGNALAMVVSASAGGGSAGGAAGGSKEPAGLPCPRCESTDTKFCYYNNYNLGQPRHFCKGCRRYWTRGGALRNVPVGGGTRKPSSSLAAARRNKRAASSSSSTTATATAMPLSVSAAAAYPTMAPRSYDLPQAAFMAPVRADRRLLDFGGSFTSLLAHASSSTTTATLAPPDGRFSAGRFLLGGGLHQAPAGMMMPTPASPAPALLQQPDCMPPPHQPMMPQASAFPEGFVWGMGWPDLSI